MVGTSDAGNDDDDDSAIIKTCAHWTNLRPLSPSVFCIVLFISMRIAFIISVYGNEQMKAVFSLEN